MLSAGYAPERVIATEFGSPAEVAARYFDGSEKNLAASLSCLPAAALGVDATALDRSPSCWRAVSPVASPPAPQTSPPAAPSTASSTASSSSAPPAAPAAAPATFAEEPFWRSDQPPIDGVVFNFPQTDKHGKSARLVRRCRLTSG